MRSFSARLRWACILVVPLWAATAVGEPRGTLTLADAVQAALALNPELAAGAYELKAADARKLQAGLRPNPELALELENFAGTDAVRGTGALETTLSLSQVVELAGKRQLRMSLAGAESDAVALERQARQLDVLAEVAQRFIDLVAAQERLALSAEARDLAQRTFDAIAARVAAARTPEAERSRARIALTRASVEERQAQSEHRAARLALASLWGSVEPAFGSAQADLQALEPVEPFDALTARLQRTPELLRFASEARLREAELRLARAQARPDLTLGLGVRRFNEGSDTALVAQASMPLALFDRNEGAIREAQVRVAQSGALREAAYVRARATLHALHEELLASQGRFETLRAEALPLARQALEQTESGYQRGRFSYLELATAQQELLELRVAVIEAAADHHRLRAEIERLTGEPLATPAPLNPERLP